jgi:hypothetical protein
MVISKSSIDNIKNIEWSFYRGNCLDKSKEADIVFKDGKVFNTKQSYGENLTILEGFYKFESGTLTIFYDEKSGHTYNPGEKMVKILMDKTICTYKNNDNGLLYNSYFKCDNGFYLYNESDKTTEGEKRQIDNTPVRTIGYKMAITTSNVKIRKKPSLKSKSIIYNSEAYGKKPYVPKGVEIAVIARTAQKDKIGDWNNYWYYVNVFDYFNNNLVWMYGEFIKFK